MKFINFVARAQGDYLREAVNGWLEGHPNVTVVSVTQSQSEGEFLDPMEKKFIRTTFVVLSLFYRE